MYEQAKYGTYLAYIGSRDEEYGARRHSRPVPPRVGDGSHPSIAARGSNLNTNSQDLFSRGNGRALLHRCTKGYLRASLCKGFYSNP